MHYVRQCDRRVDEARSAATRAPHLDVHTRVLLAAAEAADASLPRILRGVVACVIADKAAVEILDAATVSQLRSLICSALESIRLQRLVAPSAITKITWRLVFDLWGGPLR